MYCRPHYRTGKLYVFYLIFYFVVNAAIEKLLTFSDDECIKEESSTLTFQGVPSSTAVKEDSVRSSGSDYSMHQWVNLPPLFPKQDSLNSMPYINPSPQWVYPYPYSIYGPPQPVAGSYQAAAMSSMPPAQERSGQNVVAQRQPERHTIDGKLNTMCRYHKMQNIYLIQVGYFR